MNFSVAPCGLSFTGRSRSMAEEERRAELEEKRLREEALRRMELEKFPRRDEPTLSDE